MCTVTYIPAANGYCLASNRDEKMVRKKALAPANYLLSDTKVFYPKDAEAGGTWIVLKENGDSVCLLNGAFENFENNGQYTQSRGMVVLEIAAACDMIEAFDKAALQLTAPFTMVIVNNWLLFECRWDGVKKYCSELNKGIPYIWSSVTLYDRQQQEKRSGWFKEWLGNNAKPTLEQLLDFHKNTGEGSYSHDLVMNRNNLLLTVSITGIAVSDTACLMQYTDLENDESKTIECSRRSKFAASAE